MRLVENETRIKMSQRRNFVNYATMTLSDGTVLNLTPADFRISGNSFTDDWVDGEAFQIGSVIGKTATMLLDNTDGRTEVVGTDTITYPNGKFSEYDFYMAYFTLYVCFPDAYTYGSSVRDQMIRIGKFTVVNPVANSSTIEITGVDEMYKFDQSFDDCTLDFSSGVSLISILNRCCEDCKVAIGYTGFENENLVVTKKPEGVTYRQVVSYVCQMAGCNAVISETGALTLKWYTDVNTAFAGLDGGTFNNVLRHHVPNYVEQRTWTSGEYIYWGLSYPDPFTELGTYLADTINIEPVDPDNANIDLTIKVINDRLPEPYNVLKTIVVNEPGVVYVNTELPVLSEGSQFFIMIYPNQSNCDAFNATLTCSFAEPRYAGEEQVLMSTFTWTGSAVYSGYKIYFDRLPRSGRYRITRVYIEADDPTALTGTEQFRARISYDGGSTYYTPYTMPVYIGDNELLYDFYITEHDDEQFWFQVGRDVVGDDPKPFKATIYYVPLTYDDGDTADGGSFDDGTPLYVTGDTIDGGNFTTPLPYHNLQATKATQVSTDDVEFTSVIVNYDTEEDTGNSEKSIHYRSYDHNINFPTTRSSWLTNTYVNQIFLMNTGGTSSDDTIWVFNPGETSVTLANGDYAIVVKTAEAGYVYKFKKLDWQHYPMVVSENPFITADNAVTIANTLWNKVGDMKFRPFSCSTIQDPTIEAGDCVLVYDTKGNEYRTVVTNVQFTTGGYTELNCKAESPIKQTSSYVNPAAQAVVRAEKKMNEYNAQVAHFNELASAALGYYKTLETDGDTGASITYIHNAPSLETSTTIWKITGDGIFISEDGGQSYNNGYDASTGTMLMNLVYAKGLSCDWIKTGELDVGVGNEYGKGTVFRAFTNKLIATLTVDTAHVGQGIDIPTLAITVDSPLSVYVDNIGTGTLKGYATLQKYDSSTSTWSNAERIYLQEGYNEFATKLDHTTSAADDYYVYCYLNYGATYDATLYVAMLNTSIGSNGIDTSNINITGGGININNLFRVSRSGIVTIRDKYYDSTDDPEEHPINGGYINMDDGNLNIHNKLSGGPGVFCYKTSSSYYSCWGAVNTAAQDSNSAGGYISTRTKNVVQAGVNASDKRLKKNIKDIDPDFAKSLILGIKPKSFHYKENLDLPAELQFGVIAQDILKIEKEFNVTEKNRLCYEESDGMLAVEYKQLFAPIIKVIQIQQDEINDLKQRIEQLENIVNNSK